MDRNVFKMPWRVFDDANSIRILDAEERTIVEIRYSRMTGDDAERVRKLYGGIVESVNTISAMHGEATPMTVENKPGEFYVMAFEPDKKEGIPIGTSEFPVKFNAQGQIVWNGHLLPVRGEDVPAMLALSFYLMSVFSLNSMIEKNVIYRFSNALIDNVSKVLPDGLDPVDVFNSSYRNGPFFDDALLGLPTIEEINEMYSAEARASDDGMPVAPEGSRPVPVAPEGMPEPKIDGA